MHGWRQFLLRKRHSIIYVGGFTIKKSVEKSAVTISGEFAYAALRAVNFEFARNRSGLHLKFLWVNNSSMQRPCLELAIQSTVTFPLLFARLFAHHKTRTLLIFNIKILHPLENLIFYACSKNGWAIPIERAWFFIRQTELVEGNIRQFRTIAYPFPKYLQKKVDSILQ